MTGAISIYRDVHLLAKLCKSRRVLRYAVVGVRLDLVGRQKVSVEKELTHELLPIIDPQVRVAVVGTRVVSGVVHDVLSVIHQLRTHLRQLLHVFHISLQLQ